ncbi:MAG: MotA/TolQ/ExbB proton channel family protein [Planctomycetota bacterium]|nr:MAG: MotA/TolQ/ExbB proton channel family protein [Planctomycetota bacterium]
MGAASEPVGGCTLVRGERMIRNFSTDPAASDCGARRWCGSRRLRGGVVRWGLVATVMVLACFTVAAQGQQAAPNGADGAAGGAVATERPAEQPTVWDLAVQGGFFMIPIAVCSIVVLAFAIERMIALREAKVLPPELMRELQRMANLEKGLDPREAYRLCQKHHSPLASAVRAALLKAGRPQPEVEKAVEDAVEREAALMARNIRPINVVATVAPLLGLIGTVQGMIIAFMVTSTTTSTGVAKAQELAQGIYTALVTTFSGLCVAVVAVLLGSFLEGRIDNLLHKMEDVFVELLHAFERFEGKIRVARTVSRSEAAAASDSAVALEKAAVGLNVVPRESARSGRRERAAADVGPAVSAEPEQTAPPKSLWETMAKEKTVGVRPSAD